MNKVIISIGLCLSACSNVPVLDLANQDLVSPGSVTQFSATTGTNQVTLAWANPSDRDLAGVRIVRKAGSYPASADDGTIIFDSSGSQVADTATVNLTEYYYAAYAFDASRNYGQPAKARSASCSANITCPAGYILVGANTSVRAYCQFCVAQYEMKNVAGVATSQAANAPWTSITQADARTQCSALGTGYHLMTNAERMAIARETESIAGNWSSGTVGTGYVNRGWSANSTRGDSWSNTTVAASTAAGCLYNTAADTCAAAGTHTFKRTHTLTAGGTLWDFTGNVAEYLDWTVEAKDLAYSFGPIAANNYEFTGVNAGTGMPAETWRPGNTTYDSTYGIGLYATGGGSITAARVFGSFDDGIWSGIYGLAMGSVTASNSRIGFRCAYAQ